MDNEKKRIQLKTPVIIAIAAAVVTVLLLCFMPGKNSAQTANVPEESAGRTRNDLAAYTESVEDPDKAMEELMESISGYTGDDAGLALLNVKLGWLYAVKGDWVKSRDTLELSVLQDPGNADAWLLLYRACYNLDDYAGASEALTQYSQLAEPSYDEYLMLSTMQFQQGNYAGAAETCTLALGCEGCDELALRTMRAKSYLEIKNYAGCREDAQRCIELGGDYTENITMIASSYENENDHAGLLKTLMDMIDHGIEDKTVYQNALACAVDTENYAAQEKLILRLMEYEMDEDTEDTLRESLSKAQFRMKKFPEAGKNLNICLEKKEDPELRYMHGVCLMNMSDFDNAYEDFGKALDAEYNVDECHYNMALCQIGRGFPVDAGYELNSIIQRNGNPEMVKLAQELLEKLNG